MPPDARGPNGEATASPADPIDRVGFAARSWRLPAPLPPTSAPRAFANDAALLPGWFALARSRQLRGDRMKEVTVGPRKLVLFRDPGGVARALDARCPHLGANLALGKIIDGQVRCALHHWCFDGGGTCTSSPGTMPLSARRARSYPVVEKYGLIFVYPGSAPAPAFPALPDGDDERRFHALVLPPARMRCHHHLATGNGLDALHFDHLHDIEPLAEGRLQVDEAACAVHLELEGRYRGRLLRTLTGGHVHGRFSAIGPSVAWVTLFQPLRWHALFVTRPTGANACESRAVLFLPRGQVLRTFRSALFLLSLGRQDGQMLSAFESFRPAFTDADTPLAIYAQLLERWPRE